MTKSHPGKLQVCTETWCSNCSLVDLWKWPTKWGHIYQKPGTGMQHLKSWHWGLNLKITWHPFAQRQKTVKLLQSSFCTACNSTPDPKDAPFWGLFISEVKFDKTSMHKCAESILRIHIPMSLTLEIEFIHSEIQIKKALPLASMYHCRFLFHIITATLREGEMTGFQLKEKNQV